MTSSDDVLSWRLDMDNGLPWPISDQSRVCLRRFRLVWDALQRADRLDLQLPRSLIADEMERFKMWAGNIGAIYIPGRRDASLDLRLVDAPLVANQVLEFLEALARDLDSGMQSLEIASLNLLILLSSLANCIR